MGASMKEIKLRIKSVQSTRQITKAMELVASSKVRRARERIERTEPYFNILYDTMSQIAYGKRDFTSPFVEPREEVQKVCYVIIAGDRGLAGGYNSNIMKLVENHMKEHGHAVCAVPVGKKAAEFCQRKEIEVLTGEYNLVENVTIGNCFEAAHMLKDAFRAGAFDELYVIYTNFVSMMTQHATAMQVLPVPYEKEAAKDDLKSLVLYEPSPEAVFNAVVPEYISGIFYGALCQSYASEQAARRTAMDAASKNADDMIEDLSLKYNRARQGAITQEITEIVAGAEN
ncbi:MAG: ATP synthase F1 subunit gamma [Eubacteriales bacterium]|nr:ATP synthase F1 subunit gamma [Eubacteriales bacterium]